MGVQVSVDNGRSGRGADLARDQYTQFGWRQFEYEWTTPRDPGYYTIMARANDANGNAQPFAAEWNPSGYGNNVVSSVSVSVGVPTGLRGDTVDAYRTPSQEFQRACVTCHEMNVIEQQRLTRAQWDREITKMTNWGAQVKSEDRDKFLDYLFANFGPRK